MSTPAQKVPSAADTFDSVVIADERLPSPEQKTAADAIVKKHLLDNCGAMDAHFNQLKGIILHALAISTTSKSVARNDPEWIKVKFGTTNVVIGDAAFVAALDTAGCLSKFPNKVRAWARSNAKFYVDFYKANHAKLQAVTRGLSGGLQSKHGVASADFLITGAGLDLEEEAALAQYRKHMLDQGVTGSAYNPVNLYELGKGR